MDIIQAIILGIVQGLFEWLPVSSQGQIAGFAISFFGIKAEEALSYAIFLHIGTLIAAIVYFRKELLEIVKGKEEKMRNFLVIALLATGITALPSYIFLKSIAGSGTAILFLTAVMLFVTGFLQRTKNRGKEKEAGLTKKNSIVLGLAQGFAVLPGVSRSGVTTAALLFEGFKPEEAFRISFLLSVPSVLAGELVFGLVEGFAVDVNALVALVFAFAFGLASIDALIKLARKINFSLFCFAFGVLYLLIAALAVLG